jgi:phytanoyl-CoA hydroxylase
METDSSTVDNLYSEGMTLSDRMHFEEHGYVILRRLASEDIVQRMLKITLNGLEQVIPPVEYEADLQYPGSPDALVDLGGKTIRRLKQAHSRGIVFTERMTFPPLIAGLKRLLGPELVCPLAHHNCIMTKEPQFSSDTGWHQDIRYWSFPRPDLISAWLAIGNENRKNGCLQLVPGSHRMKFDQHQFDEEFFFRDDLPENQNLIGQSVHADLESGDVLLFHCRTLHAATRNHTTETKYSVVFTFRGAENSPIHGSRSAASPELLIP